MGVRVSRTKHPVAGKQPEQGGVRVTDRGLGAAGSCGGPSANLSSSSARIMEGRGCSRPHHLQPHRASRCRHTAEAARPPRSTPSPPTRPLFLAIDFIFMVGRGIVCHRPCSRNRSTGLGCALTTQSLSREAILLLLARDAKNQKVTTTIENVAIERAVTLVGNAMIGTRTACFRGRCPCCSAGVASQPGACAGPVVASIHEVAGQQQPSR